MRPVAVLREPRRPFRQCVPHAVEVMSTYNNLVRSNDSVEDSRNSRWYKHERDNRLQSATGAEKCCASHHHRIFSPLIKFILLWIAAFTSSPGSHFVSRS